MGRIVFQSGTIMLFARLPSHESNCSSCGFGVEFVVGECLSAYGVEYWIAAIWILAFWGFLVFVYI